MDLYPRPDVAFDIDGILARFSDGFVPWVKTNYGVTMVHNKGKFHWSAKPGMTGEMFTRTIAEFIRDCSHNKIHPFKSGITVARWVYEMTEKPILFVTARDHSTAGATHQWLMDHFRRPFMLSIVNTGNEKLKYLYQYGSFIDDRRKTAVHLASRGKTVFMPITNYNQPVPLNRGSYDVFYPAEWKSADIHKIDGRGRIILVNDTIEIKNGLFNHFIFKFSGGLPPEK